MLSYLFKTNLATFRSAILADNTDRICRILDIRVEPPTSRISAMSDFFNITLPEHNLWEEKEVPGTYEGITEGYFLFLNPLPPGNHTLYYEAATNPPNPNVYAQAVTYHLNVK